MRAFYRGYSSQSGRRAGQVRRLHVMREDGKFPGRQGLCGAPGWAHTHSPAVILDPLPATPPDGLTWCNACVGHAANLVLQKPEFSCNDLRDVLPELGHGFLGAAINALRNAGIIAHTDRMVPSTQASTHGHRIAVWKLTGKGIGIAARSAAARREQRKAAA
ncbi:hypothetical protein [Streptomyces scabiei]|uniref:hypothetical protein n=1 Tax=Streptomyces scabiei TaxID=1930 RepID=UPI0029BD41B1|nr:hypothetical protein [Streptomyces scabiei]MDX3033925.1 hypothetical protein [Streptomyces scabiei]